MHGERHRIGMVYPISMNKGSHLGVWIVYSIEAASERLISSILKQFMASNYNCAHDILFDLRSLADIDILVTGIQF
jgi:hypothetical protein